MQVSYNGISMSLVHSRPCSRTPVMSDDGTEMLFMRYIYDLEMEFNPYATSYTNTDPPAALTGSLPSLTDRSIRYALMQERKKLLILADEPGSSIVMESPADGYDVDASNGPFPMECTVRAITPRTWKVSWKVRTDVIECGYLDRDTVPIVSNRWSQTQSTGLDHRTTIVTRGVTRFRTDQLDAVGRNADYYRGQCIPGLPLRFQRQAVNVTVNSAGDTLAWEVTDVEQFVFIGATSNAARLGVVSFNGVFSTQSASLDGAKVPSGFIICQFDCIAFGDANSSKQGMFDWLARLAVERCAIGAGPVLPDTQALILSVRTEEDLHGPRVGLHITLQVPPAKEGLLGFGTLRGDFIGVDIINTFTNDGESPQMPQASNTRGTANTQLFVNALKEACSEPYAPPTRAGLPSGSPGDNVLDTTVISVEISDTPPQATTTSYSTDATSNGVYTEMEVETTYSTNMGLMACPIAARSASGSNGQSSGGGASAPDLNIMADNDVEVLTLSRPMTKIRVVWEAERCSISPMVPNPKVNNMGWTLLFHEVSPVAVFIAADGNTPVYRIGGVAEYVTMKARGVTDSVSYGVHPWSDFLFTDQVAQFDSSNFVHGLIDDVDGSDGDTGGGGGGQGGVNPPGTVV